MPKTLKIQGFSKFSSLSFSDTDCKSEFQVHFVSPATNHRIHHQITKHKILSSLPLPPDFPPPISTPLRPEQPQPQNPDLSTILKIATNTTFRSHLHSQKIHKFRKFFQRSGGNKNSGKPQGPTDSVISF